IFAHWFGPRLLAKGASFSLLKMREAIFSRLPMFPMSYYDRQPQGRIIVRITHDVEGIENFFTSSLEGLLKAVFFSISAIAAMLLTDFSLGLTLSFCVLPAFVFVIASRRYARQVNRNISRTSSTCNSKLAEYIDGLPVIRIFGLEKWIKQNYDNFIKSHLNAQLQANSFYSWSRPLTTFLCGVPFVVLVWFGGKEVMAGTLGVGVFVAFSGYCNSFFQSIMALSQEFHIIQQAFSNAERVAGFLKQSTEDQVLGEDGIHQTAADGGPLKGGIDFQNVSMSYDGINPVLKDVDFSIKAGEKVGFIGRTGSGKSSTISLLSRLYEFQSGDIVMDGRSIREYSRAFLRGNIGFVSQDVMIHRGTWGDNLSFEPVGNDKMKKCCEQTGLWEIMKKSNRTFDSQISEGGHNLSSGEKQLLCFTRIFLQNPAILILDEATANMDEHHEQQVHQTIDMVMKNRTCIIVAHRLAGIKNCDRIFQFDQGRVKEVIQN
ncbi:MAG: ABC transporter ATP-binding protein, partial [Halobacteriovoraceae bacterium]|nr:ABC transporter ATP-binding protein [Halobacteriovoraceae bacterium]